MSYPELARRTACKIFLNYRDVSADLEPNLTSLTYVDNEDEETDDLQLQLADADGLFAKSWFGDLVNFASVPPSGVTEYVVIEKAGLTVRSGAGEKYAKLGTLPYGARLPDADIATKWSKIAYSGKTGYVLASGLKKEMAEPSGGAPTDASALSIGDEVTVTGRPQYTSYGEGTPGAYVERYTGKVTYLNLREGVPYPVCVASLGWFSLADVGFGGSGDGGERKEGMKIQAVIAQLNRDGDGKDRELDCGFFELDSVKLSGPPTVVTIKATSLPYTSTIRKVKKTRSWENITLSEIAAEIAGKNGMTSMYLPHRQKLYKRVEQNDVSDIAFLEKLCADAGYRLKVANNILIVFDQIGDKTPVREITPESDFLKYSISTGKDSTYTSCRVSYYSPDGVLIEGYAYRDDYKEDNKNNEQLEIRQRVESVAEAEALAAAQLKKHNKFAVKPVFTFPGSPALQAGLTVRLTGWGALSGDYVIAKATHTVGSGYTTQIELREANGV